MVKTDLYIDPETEAIVIRSVDENNEVIKSLPQIRLKLSDLQYAEQIDSAHAIEAIMRCIHFKRPSDNAQRCCYGTFTISQDDSAANWSSPNIEDLYIGGGAGGGVATDFYVVAVGSLCLKCTPIPPAFTVTAVSLGGPTGSGYVAGDILAVVGGTGTAATLTVVGVNGSGAITSISIASAGSYTVNPATPNSPTGGHGSAASINLGFGGYVYIALPWRLRTSGSDRASENRLGITHTLGITSGADALNVDRIDSWTDGGGAHTEYQRVVPIWFANEIIHAIPANTCGMVDFDNGDPVTWLMIAPHKIWMQHG